MLGKFEIEEQRSLNVKTKQCQIEFSVVLRGEYSGIFSRSFNPQVFQEMVVQCIRN